MSHHIAYHTVIVFPQISVDSPDRMIIRIKFEYKKSVRTCTCYPSHTLKALALPTLSKRATRSLTPICIYATLHHTNHHDWYNKGVRKHTHEAFTVALFLTNVKNLRDSTESKPKRQVNAFSIMSSPTHEPCRRERCDKNSNYL